MLQCPLYLVLLLALFYMYTLFDHRHDLEYGTTIPLRLLFIFYLI